MMMADEQETQLESVQITRAEGGQWQMQSGRRVKACDAWKIGLSASDVRWLLGIPDPPRKPMSYKVLLRRCERQGCTWVAGITEGWEVCPTHGTARKKAQ